MWESRRHRPHRPGELWLRTRLAPVFSSAGAFALRALVLGLGAGPGVRGCSVPPSVSVFAVRPRFLRHGRAASFVALCGALFARLLSPRCSHSPLRTGGAAPASARAEALPTVWRCEQAGCPRVVGAGCGEVPCQPCGTARGSVRLG